MKNIYILKTGKPSRLALDGKELFLSNCLKYPSYLYDNIHLYITSDEDIKDGDWMIRGNEQPIKVTKDFFWDFGVKYYKIILTTDQDLINDGVQAIDDEFLEWFVKNPSCEEVEVIEQYRKCCRNTDGKNENCIESINCEGWLSNEYERPYKTNCDKRFEGYKIIIPKEEPKQETLEEATERLAKYTYKKHSVKNDKLSLNEQIQRSGGFIVGFKEGMIEGAKWQAEKMYSEEEVLQLLNNLRLDSYNYGMGKTELLEWFEQYKKNN